jgi:hypothetical protein
MMPQRLKSFGLQADIVVLVAIVSLQPANAESAWGEHGESTW